MTERGAAPGAERDREVIRALVEAGADLSRPLLVDHFLTFRDRPAAEAAADLLDSDDRVIEVAPEPLGRRWLVHVAEPTLVSEETIAAARAGYEAVAAGLGGTYDGWGVALEPPTS